MTWILWMVYVKVYEEIWPWRTPSAFLLREVHGSKKGSAFVTDLVDSSVSTGRKHWTLKAWSLMMWNNRGHFPSTSPHSMNAPRVTSCRMSIRRKCSHFYRIWNYAFWKGQKPSMASFLLTKVDEAWICRSDVCRNRWTCTGDITQESNLGIPVSAHCVRTATEGWQPHSFNCSHKIIRSSANQRISWESILTDNTCLDIPMAIKYDI